MLFDSNNQMDPQKADSNSVQISPQLHKNLLALARITPALALYGRRLALPGPVCQGNDDRKPQDAKN